MPRLKLEIDDEINFLLFGICSNAKDYRICWSINKNLDIHLVRNNDIKVDELNRFAFFTFDDDSTQTKYFLVANKNEGRFFSKELKQMDYLLIVEGNYESVDPEEMLLQIKKPEIILAAYQLDTGNLKSKQQFIFE